MTEDDTAKVAPEEEKNAKAEEKTEPVAKADGKAPAKAPEGTVTQKPPAQPENLESQQMMLFAGILAFSVFVSFAQQSQVFSGGDVQAWFDSLFAEHVVPPPIAHDHVCTIQFCQS